MIEQDHVYSNDEILKDLTERNLPDTGTKCEAALILLRLHYSHVILFKSNFLLIFLFRNNGDCVGLPLLAGQQWQHRLGCR